MTEFTSEKMAEWRHMIKNIRSQPVESGREYLLTGVLANALDEIERLQQRIAELEQERRWVHEDKTMIVKKDGDSWCAVLPDFENLQQSERRWFSGDVNKYMDDVYGFLNPLPNHPRRTVNDERRKSKKSIRQPR